MGEIDELIKSLTTELKRGALVLTVLSQLKDYEYGYSLVQKFDDKNIPIEAGTLYPLLRRMEKQNLLTSSWDTNDNRPRKFYIMSDYGREVYNRLKTEWRILSNQLEALISEEE